MRGSGSVLILLCAMISGCVAPPKQVDVPEAVPVPAAWSMGTGGESKGEPIWWETFASPELTVLLEEAFAGNPDLQTLMARVDAAAASARIAGADLYPGVSAGLDGARRRQNFIGFPIPGSTSNVLSTRATTYGLSLGTNWEIDLWGRRRAGKRAALADREAAGYDLEMRRLSLAAQVTKLWVSAVAAKRQLAVAQESAESFADTAAKIDSRYREGLQAAFDLKLAENSAQSARALVAEREQQLIDQLQQLEVLLGRFPRAALEVVDVLPDVKGPVVAGIPSSVLERRPDLRAAERRLAAADQRLWESKAALFPQISLSASTGTSTAELGDLLDTDFSVWSLAGNVAQPLLQGGRLRAGVDLSKARIREVTAQYVGVVLQAFREVEFGLASERLLREREEFVQAAATQSASALEVANRRYESGLADIISVLESQRRSLADATQVIAVRQARLMNRIDLYLALGGGAGEIEVVER